MVMVAAGLVVSAPFAPAAMSSDGATAFAADHVIVRDVIGDAGGGVIVVGQLERAATASYRGYFSTGFVARYTSSGVRDVTFGVNGYHEVPVPLESVARLSDGRIVVAGTCFDLDCETDHGNELYLLSPDGRTETVVPLYVPSAYGVHDLVEVPDGRIAVIASGIKAIWMLGADGTIDMSFDGRIPDRYVNGYREYGTYGVSGDIDSLGRLVATFVHRGFNGMNEECVVMAFDGAGVVDDSFSLAQIPNATPPPTRAWPSPPCTNHVDQSGQLLMSHRDRFSTHPLTYRYSADGSSPTAAPDVFHITDKRGLAVEGTGRIFVPTATELRGYLPDGTLDPSFEADGVWPLPITITNPKVRILASGEKVVFGGSPTEVALVMVEGSAGVARQPPSVTPSRFVPLAPARFLDTRTGLGYPAGPIIAGATALVALGGLFGVPQNATAVVVNIVATDAAGAGFVTLFPGGGARPLASALNLEWAGQTASNLVTVPLGDNGYISIYTAVGAHFVGDVQGYYVASGASAAGRFQQPPFPRRILDTRTPPTPTLAQGGQIDFLVAGVAGVPQNVAAVVVNLTATGATDAGFVTAWPSGLPRPLASNLNVAPGETKANLAIVPLNADGRITIYASVAVDAVVDVFGWFTDETAAVTTNGLFVPVVPTRVLDTRSASANPLAPGTLLRRVLTGSKVVPAARRVDAVVLNVTATETVQPGYITVSPGAVDGISSLNAWRAHQTIPNASIVGLAGNPISGAGIALLTQAGGHLVVDLTGYYLSGL